MDAQSIKVKLQSQIIQVLTHLFPDGQIKGRDFHVGSLQGEKGRSLSVSIDGDTAGLWIDRATGDKGDIFSLWMGCKGISFVAALDEARRYLGITEVKKFTQKKPNGFARTDYAPVKSTPSQSYLINQRGISEETLTKYMVRTHPDSREPAYAFPYITPDKERAFIKYCSITRDERGKKKIWSTPPYATLWGWWLVLPSDRSIIITEGEIDAMTVSQMNPSMPVLSMPSGTGNTGWIDNDYDALNQFEIIHIVTDRDEAGDLCAEAISKRLGQSRVMRVPIPLPYKDPNEMWMSGDESLMDWSAISKEAFFYTPPTIRRPSSYIKEAQRLNAKAKEERLDNKFMFSFLPYSYRDGETTIVSGYPGHGKSDWLYQTHIHEMKQGKKAMICSLEIPPAKMLVVLTQQYFGHLPSDSEIEEMAFWLDDRMVYHSGQSARGPDVNLQFDELLKDMEYAYRRYGATRFIIDSLHFLVAKDDYEKQDLITRTLSQFDLNHGVHTALVAHSNLKGQKEGHVPGRHDVEGSGGMIKPIDNGITIWRNEEKQESLQDPIGHNTTTEKAEALHDGLMKVWKQRENGQHPTVKMWFDQNSRTFRTQPWGVAHFFSRSKAEEKEKPVEQTKDSEGASNF